MCIVETEIYANLLHVGGIYMNEFTLLKQLSAEYRHMDVVQAMAAPITGTTAAAALTSRLMTRIGWIDAKTPHSNKSKLSERQHSAAVKDKQDANTKLHRFSCHAQAKYDAVIDNRRRPAEGVSCVVLKETLYPKDIWGLDTPFGRLARTVFYGKEEIVTSMPSYDELVPNIAHIVWIGGGEMNFHFYLCVLSLLHVAKVHTSTLIFSLLSMRP